MNHHIPNFITLSRIVLTPLYLWFLFGGHEHGYSLALVVFIAAGLTDLWDGHLARRMKVESSLGKMLDPIADKVLIISAFVAFVWLDLVSGWMVAVIILRDVVITGLRFVLERRDRPLRTSKAAKGKTAAQMTIIIFGLAYLSLKSYQVSWITSTVERLDLILILMSITVLVTVYTGVDYFISNRAAIMSLSKPTSQ